MHNFLLLPILKKALVVRKTQVKRLTGMLWPLRRGMPQRCSILVCYICKARVCWQMMPRQLNICVKPLNRECPVRNVILGRCMRMAAV